MTRWSISIGVSLHLHADGDKSRRHLCRNLNMSRFEEEVYKYTNRPISLFLTTKYLSSDLQDSRYSSETILNDFMPHVRNSCYS